MLAKENDHYYNSQCGNNGGILFLEKNKNVFNECLYASRGNDYVVQHVAAKVGLKNNCSFFIHFSFLKKGLPMMEYE